MRCIEQRHYICNVCMQGRGSQNGDMYHFETIDLQKYQEGERKVLDLEGKGIPKGYEQKFKEELDKRWFERTSWVLYEDNTQ